MIFTGIYKGPARPRGLNRSIFVFYFGVFTWGVGWGVGGVAEPFKGGSGGAEPPPGRCMGDPSPLTLIRKCGVYGIRYTTLHHLMLLLGGTLKDFFVISVQLFWTAFRHIF